MQVRKKRQGMEREGAGGLAPGDDYLTTSQIAGLCGVSTATVIRWIDTGKLKGFKLPSGHRRAVYEEVNEFLVRFGMPLPAGESPGEGPDAPAEEAGDGKGGGAPAP